MAVFVTQKVIEFDNAATLTANYGFIGVTGRTIAFTKGQVRGKIG